MKIEVLIATMNNDRIKKLISEMNIKTDCIVVNQCNCIEENIIVKKINGLNVKIINSPDKGLSKSRNKALENVSVNTDIVVFTDDDIVFDDNYVENIKMHYEKDNCDGYVFNVIRSDGRTNKKLSKYINQLTLFRVCSVSMTFKYNSIKNIKFDEQFGAGSDKYILGEENIFMSDCLKKKLEVKSENCVMCKIVNKRPSTWYSGMNEKFLFSKGASFKRMHNRLYPILNIDFAIRKLKRYKKNMSFFKALNVLFAGSKSYEVQK